MSDTIGIGLLDGGTPIYGVCFGIHLGDQNFWFGQPDFSLEIQKSDWQGVPGFLGKRQETEIWSSIPAIPKICLVLSVFVHKPER